MRITRQIVVFDAADPTAESTFWAGLGARLLKPADDIESASGYQVYADRAGHLFCLGWG